MQLDICNRISLLPWVLLVGAALVHLDLLLEQVRPDYAQLLELSDYSGLSKLFLLPVCDDANLPKLTAIHRVQSMLAEVHTTAPTDFQCRSDVSAAIVDETTLVCVHNAGFAHRLASGKYIQAGQRIADRKLTA